MRRTRRRMMIAAALLVAVALVFAFPAPAYAADPCFTAVNDTVLELRDATMPFFWGGEYYVPYTVFSRSLGLSSAYSHENYTLVIYNQYEMLTFDLVLGSSYSQSTRYEKGALRQNGTVYVPAEFVCKQFRLGYSHIPAAPVPIVRLTSDSRLDDSAFRLKNIDEMARLYDNYMNRASAPPDTRPSDGEPQVSVVYLTFDGALGAETPALLDALDESGMGGTFFLPEDIISEHADTLRRMVGSGYAVGLTEAGAEGEIYASPAQLAGAYGAANDRLDAAAYTKTRLIRFSAGSDDGVITEAMRDALVEQGYRYWDWTEEDTEQSVSRRISALVSAVRNEPVSVLRIRMDGDTAEVLEGMAQSLSSIPNREIIYRTISPSEAPINFFDDIR